MMHTILFNILEIRLKSQIYTQIKITIFLPVFPLISLHIGGCKSPAYHTQYVFIDFNSIATIFCNILIERKYISQLHDTIKYVCVCNNCHALL